MENSHIYWNAELMNEMYQNSFGSNYDPQPTYNEINTIPNYINYNVQPTKTYVNPLIFMAKPTKVLVNPHFKKQTVHVNPHFNLQNSTYVNTQKCSVHVNPLVLKQMCNKPSENIVRDVPKKELSYISKTRTKLVRAITPRNRIQCSIAQPINYKTQYKLVRSSVVRTPVRRSSIKTKYKIDRRKIKSPKHVFSNRSKSKLVWVKNTPVKSKINMQTSYSLNYIKIGGVAYKSSGTKLKKYVSAVDNVVPKQKKVISIKGQNYVMNLAQKTIKKISKTNTVIIKKHSYSNKKYVFPKKDVTTFITPSKFFLKSRNKLKKNNLSCPFYRRFGRCKRNENGTCSKVHDTKQISICKKFLRGECDIKTCTLSHDVRLEKMPTCKFYLDGFCGKDDCPYLHVKLNKKTSICKDFLEGYCNAADKCDRRHVYVCPDFEKYGKCGKHKCPYPHKSQNVKKIKTSETKGDVKKILFTNRKRKSVSGNKEVKKDEVSIKKNGERYMDAEKSGSGLNLVGQSIISSRGKLPNLLPDYIPFR